MRTEELKRTLRELDASGRRLPAALENLNVDTWETIRSFMVRVCHHGHEVDDGEFEQWVDELERFLLDRLRPRTFDDLSKIQEAVRGAETSD